MRGRKPKPTAMKLVQGNPGKRAINGSEPKPEPGIPSCPDHLHGAAREEWDRIVVELSKIGLLTLADRAAIAAYCTAYGRWVDAELLVAKTLCYKHGDLIKVNPAVRIAHDAMVLMHKYLSEFGLSPASRARLHTTEPTEEDEYEDFVRSAS
jgi:P27 family predicted phage terminase small subunit